MRALIQKFLDPFRLEIATIYVSALDPSTLGPHGRRTIVWKRPVGLGDHDKLPDEICRTAALHGPVVVDVVLLSGARRSLQLTSERSP